MTRPVVVFHNVTKETPLGNYEDLCMCFYLPAKYQADHDHSDERSSRHAAEVPPQPLDNSAVYLYTAPAHHVFVRRFGGYALTHNQWEKEMEALEADLVYDRHSYQQGQYYTAGYDSPWKLRNRFVLKSWNPCGECLCLGGMKYGCSVLSQPNLWRTRSGFKLLLS